jgi:hypothetical protein
MLDQLVAWKAACRCLATASLPEQPLSSIYTGIYRSLAQALHKLGNEESGAAFVPSSALT